MLDLQTQAVKIFQRYRSSTFLKASSWYLFASFIQRGISFLTVPIFTRLLSPDEYGTIAIFVSWLAIFEALATLNVEGAISRGKIDFSNEDFKRFVSAALTLGMGIGTLVLILFWIAPPEVSQNLFGLQKIYVLIALLSVIANTAIDAKLADWQMGSRYQQYSLLNVIIAVTQVVLSLALILLPLGILQSDPALGRILGLSLTTILFGLYYFVSQMVAGRQFINREYWKYTLVISVPLIPHTLAGLILAQFDRILIDRYIGRTEAGLYSFAYQLGLVIYMVWIATNGAWVPWFYEKMKLEAYGEIRHRAYLYLLGFLGITIAAIVVGPLFVPLLAPSRYWLSIPVVPVVMSSQFFIFMYSLYVNIEFYEKKTGYISIGTGLAAAVNVLLNIILLPRFGYIIAAWTTLASYMLLFLFHAWIAIFRLRRNIFNFRVVFGAGLVTIVAASIMYVITLH